MRKKKLIVHEKHTGKRSAEEVFAAVILAGKRICLESMPVLCYNQTRVLEAAKGMAEEFEELKLDIPENDNTAPDDGKVHVTDEMVSFLGPNTDEQTERARKTHLRDSEAKRESALALSKTSRAILSTVLLLIITADLAALGMLAVNGLYALAGKIIYIFHMDSLTYLNHSLLWVQAVTAFVLCFFLGGFLIDLLFYLGSELADKLRLYIKRKHLILVLVCFAAVTLGFTVFRFSTGGSIEMYETFRFAAPFAVYLGGIAIYGLSVLRFEIE